MASISPATGPFTLLVTGGAGYIGAHTCVALQQAGFRLVVLDKGRIVEMGDHRSLLEQGGLYARLWAHQSGGFLGEEAEAADEHTDGRALTVPT